MEQSRENCGENPRTRGQELNMKWLEDNNGNRCSVEYFGSAEAAQAALDSLKECENCDNCEHCSRCSGCTDCTRCYDCSRCFGCSHLRSESSIQSIAPPIPVIPDIHKAVYEAVIAPKHHLEMESWHTCKTTHCRGGWIVTLAGEAGKKLEDFYGSLLAAQLIYDASDPSRPFNPCRFFDSNDDALVDMKRLADRS